MLRSKVESYITSKYGIVSYDGSYRHIDNNRAFARFRKNYIELRANDILSFDELLHKDGIHPSGRGLWISVALDGSVSIEDIIPLVDISYLSTASKLKSEEIRGPKEWLIPANPEYFDIVHAFDDTDSILWKQGRGIRKDDTVHIYAGNPIAAILYRCIVTETGIPLEFTSKSLTVKMGMRIRMEKRYEQTAFPRSLLRAEYGIYSVRGPRGVPNSLSYDLERSPDENSCD